MRGILRTESSHLHRVLWIGEALERAFLQRIEDDDGDTASGRLVQRTHHARMIRARIVAHGDDELAMLEIIERDGTFADADGHG